MTRTSLPPKRILIGGLMVVAIVVAALSLASRRGVDRDRETLQLHEDCGATMAELTRRALDGEERILVLEHSGMGLPPDQVEWIQLQIAAFYDALGSGFEITKVPVGSGPSGSRAEVIQIQSGALSLRRAGFEALAASPPDADVIVSFVGEPPLGERYDVTTWAELPPVVCFSTQGEDLLELMEAGVLAAAVGPRSTPVPTKDARKRSWFEVMYEVVTPEDAT